MKVGPFGDGQEAGLVGGRVQSQPPTVMVARQAERCDQAPWGAKQVGHAASGASGLGAEHRAASKTSELGAGHRASSTAPQGRMPETPTTRMMLQQGSGWHAQAPETGSDADVSEAIRKGSGGVPWPLSMV